MIKWEKRKDNRLLGFVDGDYLYVVYPYDKGWMWEYVPDYEGAYEVLETMEEAMAEAEADNERLEAEWSEAEQFEADMEILGDRLYEERRDMGLL